MNVLVVSGYLILWLYALIAIGLLSSCTVALAVGIVWRSLSPILERSSVEENRNELGLSEEDLENMKVVMDDLIDIIARFNGIDAPDEAAYSRLKSALDFANFVVSGVIYSNALDLCASHDHDEEEDDE